MGIFDAISQGITNSQNIGLQRETNVQNEKLMRESWARDDNSVQRRVADLNAAGLSPTLAAGSAASNSGPINLQSPRATAPKGDLGELVQMAQLRTAQKQNALTDAQKALVEMEYANADAKGFYDRNLVDQMRKDAEGQGTISYRIATAMAESLEDEYKARARGFQDQIYNSDLARGFEVPTNSTGAMDAIATSRMLDKATKGKFGGPAVGAVLQLIKMFGR